MEHRQQVRGDGAAVRIRVHDAPHGFGILLVRQCHHAHICVPANADAIRVVFSAIRDTAIDYCPKSPDTELYCWSLPRRVMTLKEK